MKSLWNPANEAEIRARIASLSPDSRRMWGKMEVDQMLRHLAIAYNSAVGIVLLPDEGIMTRLASLSPAKWFIIRFLPWPKGLPTAMGFTITDQQSFDTAKSDMLQAFDACMLAKETRTFDKHPLFGSLSYDDWGILLYKHTDHHLKQFNV